MSVCLSVCLELRKTIDDELNFESIFAPSNACWMDDVGSMYRNVIEPVISPVSPSLRTHRHTSRANQGRIIAVNRRFVRGLYIGYVEEFGFIARCTIWANFGENREVGLGKSGVLKHKSGNIPETHKDRRNVTMECL